MIVKSADGRSFLDDTAWTKRPDGFWADAKFDIRSGYQAGVQGSLFDSVAIGQQGLPEFIVRGKAPILEQGDVVSLTRVNDDALPNHWWFSKDPLPCQLSMENHDKRPGSNGNRSIALKPHDAKPIEVISYLDAIGDRAGKLLPVKGTWRIRFWMRETEPGAKLTVRFRRQNSSNDVFFQETFHPTRHWQLVERSFKAIDNGAAGTLELSLTSMGNNGRILLDDIGLGPIPNQDNTTIFRPELLAALKQLKPGYLRDWQGQLGDTLENRLADPFARRSTRYRPGDGSTFSYNLEEFFQLTHAVGAQPWIILPSTLGDEEFRKIGQYLVSQINAFHFNEMLVEFGNENWNTVFRPAGISDFKAHGKVVTRAFNQLKVGTSNHPRIRTIVNGQYVYPEAALNMLDGVSNADALAVAPYFLYKLNQTDDPLATLFNQDDFLIEETRALQTRGKELMVYEVNLHTTGGNASTDLRNSVTTGSPAGAALAKRLMVALNLGVKRQCIYQLSQFDGFVEQNQGNRELVKLWGVMRDLGETQHVRPTGSAMTMLNQALPADIHLVNSTEDGHIDKDLTLTAFHRKNGWAIAAVSAKTSVQNIAVTLPGQQQKSVWHTLRLKGPSLLSDNETAENVRIVEEQITSQAQRIHFTISPYEFVMLLAD